MGCTKPGRETMNFGLCWLRGWDSALKACDGELGKLLFPDTHNTRLFLYSELSVRFLSNLFGASELRAFGT